MLPIPEHIWSRLKLRLNEARAGSVTLWLDDAGKIISADFDHDGSEDESRSRVLLRQIISEVLAERETSPRRRPATTRL